MHLGRLGLLALGAIVVEGYINTSPFFFASTSKMPTASSQLKSATSLLSDVSNKLSSCPSDYYVVAFQLGVHALDYSTRESAPRLRQIFTGEDKAIQSNFTVSEVLGEMDPAYIRALLQEKCGSPLTEIHASTGNIPSNFEKSQTISVTFPMLPLSSTRGQQLVDNDSFLATIFDRIHSRSYTLIYITTPKEFVDDEGSESIVSFPGGAYQEPLHTELKRDYVAHVREETPDSKQSLFERYQFFTPGIFMGLLASFVFMAILYVGISALTSLQVPYAAFEKDTAPGSQKKQQ